MLNSRKALAALAAAAMIAAPVAASSAPVSRVSAPVAKKSNIESQWVWIAVLIAGVVTIIAISSDGGRANSPN